VPGCQKLQMTAKPGLAQDALYIAVPNTIWQEWPSKGSSLLDTLIDHVTCLLTDNDVFNSPTTMYVVLVVVWTVVVDDEYQVLDIQAASTHRRRYLLATESVERYNCTSQCYFSYGFIQL